MTNIATARSFPFTVATRPSSSTRDTAHCSWRRRRGSPERNTVPPRLPSFLVRCFSLMHSYLYLRFCSCCSNSYDGYDLQSDRLQESERGTITGSWDTVQLDDDITLYLHAPNTTQSLRVRTW